MKYKIVIIGFILLINQHCIAQCYDSQANAPSPVGVNGCVDHPLPSTVPAPHDMPRVPDEGRGIQEGCPGGIPFLELTPPKTQGCVGESHTVTLGETHYTTLQWENFTTGEVVSTTSDLTFTPWTPGSHVYQYTATTTAGCVGQGAFILDVYPSPHVIAYELHPATCDGIPGAAEVTDYFPTIVWDNGEQGQQAFNLSPGTHTVTVTTAEGCTGVGQVDIMPGEDVIPPTIECPPDVVVTVPTGVTEQQAYWQEPVATDNCVVVSISNTHSSGNIFPLGTTLVTYSATNAGGYTSACSFDVTVIEDDSPSCPDSLYISGNIPEGTHQAAQSIISDGTVPDDCDVQFKAGDVIRLDGGFTVPSGTKFSGVIDDCTDDNQ